ncbi:hypothetical protein Vadar_034362 [Vaccinium darrowii]|uniref:Uncharacterized protein n=1 Tax=Vaccinium darrowii TaxID=229202 RepID=A0ACB7X6K0_9ERIC|nr:hypothetical protein Vadar_034362 [Vaccinium darrowii]
MGNTKPEQQPPPPQPLAAEERAAAEETFESAKISFKESAEASEIPSFTCEICIEPMSSPNKQFSNDGLCVHPFCIDCITRYINVKVEHDHAAKIKCPGLNCNQLLDPHACRSLLPPQLFEKWCDLMCERALWGLKRCYCPNRECSEVVVNECGGNVKKSKCPNCNQMFCFGCKNKWHEGYRCEETGEMRDMNDVAFAELAERMNWTRCPRCKHFVELVDGCTIVMCRICKYMVISLLLNLFLWAMVNFLSSDPSK